MSCPRAAPRLISAGACTGTCQYHSVAVRRCHGPYRTVKLPVASRLPERYEPSSSGRVGPRFVLAAPDTAEAQPARCWKDSLPQCNSFCLGCTRRCRGSEAGRPITQNLTEPYPESRASGPVPRPINVKFAAAGARDQATPALRSAQAAPGGPIFGPTCVCK